MKARRIHESVEAGSRKLVFDQAANGCAEALPYGNGMQLRVSDGPRGCDRAMFTPEEALLLAGWIFEMFGPEEEQEG